MSLFSVKQDTNGAFVRIGKNIYKALSTHWELVTSYVLSGQIIMISKCIIIWPLSLCVCVCVCVCALEAQRMNSCMGGVRGPASLARRKGHGWLANLPAG